MASDYAGNVADTIPGANQILKQGTKVISPIVAQSNRVQSGQLPRTSGPVVGSPSRAQPLGVNSSTSLNG